MSIFDSIMKAVGSKVKQEVRTAANNAVNNAVNSVGKGRNSKESFSFGKIPAGVSELQAFPEASLDSAFKTAALVMIALARYEECPEDSYAMLDWLKGPENLSNHEKAFIKERLTDKGYKIRSYFKGATPANGYAPAVPYTVEIIENPYSFDNENWATLWVKSSGADNMRSVKLRQKPSTGQWFLNDIQCLSEIRLPKEADPWA